jgi:hypothetical protein
MIFLMDGPADGTETVSILKGKTAEPGGRRP